MKNGGSENSMDLANICMDEEAPSNGKSKIRLNVLKEDDEGTIFAALKLPELKTEENKG